MPSEQTPTTKEGHPSKPDSGLEIEIQSTDRRLPDSGVFSGISEAKMAPAAPDTTQRERKELSASIRLNCKAEFWDEYSKVAKDYDGELVKDLGDDLNSLLTFAGLFSATNTAFILETMKDLKEDATQTTNDLLRSVARGLHDPNYTYQTKETPIFIASSRAIRVNAILFASLCCSLFAALGAILAKQWINHYGNWGSVRVLSEKSRERQRKLLGLERWHLEAIIQTLPSLIQLSLFLFLVALVDFLWDVDETVTAVVMGFSILTLGFYSTTTVISVYNPSSPFQNRFSCLLRKFIIDFITNCRLLIPWLRQSSKKLQVAIRRHRYHFTWTWPIVIVSLHHSSFYHVVNATSPTEFSLFYPCILLEGSFRSFAHSRRFNRLATFLGISRFFDYVPDSVEMEAEEDVSGAECVGWFWQHRSTDPGGDDAVLAVAGVLNAADIASSGYLCDLMTILLKPISENGVVISLDVDTNQLRDLLEPLSRWISQFPKAPPYYNGETEDEDSDFFSLWRQLGVKLWQLLLECPDDLATLHSISHIIQVVDSLYDRFRWSISCSGSQTEDITIAIRIQDLFHSVTRKSESDTIVADYLSILGCIHCSCSESQRSQLLSLESANFMRSALVSTLIINGNPDKEQWRGRLRLLCLQHTLDSQNVFYLSTSGEADHFAQSLRHWVDADRGINRRWICNWLRTNRSSSIGLYLATVRLLLINDHNTWYSKLDRAGHSEFIRRLMTSHGTEMFFSWQWKGKKIAPLECVLLVWYHHYKIDPHSEGSRTYMTPDWVQSVVVAVNYLGSIKSVPETERHEFAANMMESEILIQVLVSLREYLHVAVLAGLVGQKGINKIVNRYHGTGRVLEDWIRTPFVAEPDGYQSDYWRTNWKARIREECEKIASWSAGLVEQVSSIYLVTYEWQELQPLQSSFRSE